MFFQKNNQTINKTEGQEFENQQVFVVNKINIFQKKQLLQKGLSGHEQYNRDYNKKYHNFTYIQDDDDNQVVESIKAISKPDILIKKPRSSMQLKKQQKTKKPINNKPIIFEDNFIPENFKFQQDNEIQINEINDFDISMYTSREQKLIDQDQEVDFEYEFEKEVQKAKGQKQDWLKERLEFAKQLQIQMALEWEEKQQLKKEMKDEEKDELSKPKKPKKETIQNNNKLKPFK